jgi:transcriptional regulator with XRE-family HTH domain
MNPLRQWRRKQKLRALDIALRLEVSERTVLAWEHGAFKPSSEAFGKLAEITSLPELELRTAWFEWLMELKNDPNVWRDPSTPLPPSVGLRESV